MSVLILPQRFKQQPQYAAPFASGRKRGACFLGSVPVELVGKQSRVNPAFPTMSGGIRPCGRVRVAANRTSSEYYPVNIPALTDFTIYLYVSYVDAADAFQYILGLSGPGSAYLGIPAAHANISNHWGLFMGNSGGTVFLDSTEILPQNRLTSIVITRSGSAVKLFRDGVLKNTVTDSTVVPALTKMTLNSYDAESDFGAGPGTYYALAGVDTVAWSDGEVRGFSANPWLTFKAPARKLWTVSSGTPTGDTVGSSSGLATVSGVGASVAESTGSTSGVSTVSGGGASVASSTGSANGVADVSGVSDFTSASGSTGSAAGSSTVSGVGASTAASSGSGNGVATVAGVGASEADSTGSASGSATVSGVGDSSIPGSTAGTSTGAAAVSGVGASVAASTGTASGSATALGVSENPDQSQGGDDFPYVVVKEKKKKRTHRKIEEIFEDAVKEVLGEPKKLVLGTAPKPTEIKQLEPKEAVSGTAPAPVDLSAVVEEEAEKVAKLLAQYQEQVRLAEMEEDEELLMLIAMEML